MSILHRDGNGAGCEVHVDKGWTPRLLGAQHRLEHGGRDSFTTSSRPLMSALKVLDGEGLRLPLRERQLN